MSDIRTHRSSPNISSQSADDKVSQLEDEIVSLIKICEDVLSERTNMFPGSSVGALASAIVEHNNKPDQVSFIELFVKSAHELYRNNDLSDETIEAIGSCLEKIGYVDAYWYLQVNSDVAESEKKAGNHYIMWGYEEKRKPNQFS